MTQKEYKKWVKKFTKDFKKECKKCSLNNNYIGDICGKCVKEKQSEINQMKKQVGGDNTWKKQN